VVDVQAQTFRRREIQPAGSRNHAGKRLGDQYVLVKVGQVKDYWVASPSLDIPGRPLLPHEFANYPIFEESQGASKSRFYATWRAEHGTEQDREARRLDVRLHVVGGWSVRARAVTFEQRSPK
jgi:hypothetical protein